MQTRMCLGDWAFLQYICLQGWKDAVKLVNRHVIHLGCEYCIGTDGYYDIVRVNSGKEE